MSVGTGRSFENYCDNSSSSCKMNMLLPLLFSLVLFHLLETADKLNIGKTIPLETPDNITDITFLPEIKEKANCTFIQLKTFMSQCPEFTKHPTFQKEESFSHDVLHTVTMILHDYGEQIW